MRSLVICILCGCLLPVAARGEPGSPPSAPAVEASPTPTTRLYVKTLPPGAQVMVDGKPLGASDGLFLVPAGTAKVSVQFDGQDPQVRQVEIAEGRITRVEIQRDHAVELVHGIVDSTVANLGGAKPVAGRVELVGPDGNVAAGGFGAGGAGGGGMGGGGIVGGVFEGSGGMGVVSGSPMIESSQKLAEPVAPLTKFDETLEKPFDFELAETPLRDAAQLIGSKTGLHLSIDWKALEDSSLDPETPITSSASGLSLARGLDILCRPIDLAWTVEDDGIQITSAERAAERLFVHVHDVSDLCESDLLPLIDLIQSSIETNTWDTVGGEASIQPDYSDAGTFLVVSQSLTGQRQIRGFLECLRRLKAMPPAERSPIASDGYWGTAEPVLQARTALEKPSTLAFDETPLRDALTEISKKAGVPIAIDFRVLEDAGADTERPVTIASTTLPLAKLLDRILSPLDLTFDIVDDRLIVTTKEKASETMSVAIYPVHRLIGSRRSFLSLAELVQGNVRPDTWDAVGGAGSLRYVGGDVPCLVIQQTTDGHRKMDAFLRSLK